MSHIFDHFEIKQHSNGEAVVVDYTMFYRMTGWGDDKVLPDPSTDGTNFIFCHAPNWLERKFGITWDDKIAKAWRVLAGRAQRRAEREMAAWNKSNG